MLVELDKIQYKLKWNKLLPGGTSPERLQLAYKIMKAQAIFKDNVLIIYVRLPIYVNQQASLSHILQKHESANNGEIP